MQPKVSRSKRLEIYWFTVSYKQIVLWGLLVGLVAGLGGFAVFKDYIVKKYNELLEPEVSAKAGNLLRSGRFVSLVGTVKVKKADSIQWVNADPQTVLEAGDYVQTASDSHARIIFPEGTTYRLKPDSLIVVQENSEDPQTQAKKVSVRVTSGAVDLSTSRRDTVNSTSEVSAASATASMDDESRMAVETNPALKTARFQLHKGSARVVQGQQSYRIGPYERVTAESQKLSVEKVLGPPELLTPNSERPVISTDGRKTRVEFTWRPVPQARAYKIRIANSSVFSKVLREEIVKDRIRYVTSGLEEGTYYWAVSSIDANGEVSKESDPNKFTLINKASADRESDLLLSIDQVIRISNIFEIIGRTDPGASVVINEEPVPLISADGTFKHFTSPLPHKGKNIITITAQDRSGNSKTIRREVFVD
ncbi:MAG: FecR domain-containing protein [Acidobacteriota bacterium]